MAFFVMSAGGVLFALVEQKSPSAVDYAELPTVATVAYESAPATNLPTIVTELGGKPDPASAIIPPSIGEAEGQKPPSGDETIIQEAPADPGPTNPPVAAGGSADAAEVRRVQIQDAFREQMSAFRDCYDLILELEPNLSDRLVLELLVTAGDPEPTTELISIESGRMEVEHISCFAEAAGEMQIPAPDGTESYTVRYPIVLSSE